MKKFWSSYDQSTIDKTYSALIQQKLITKKRLDVYERKHQLTAKFQSHFTSSMLSKSLLDEALENERQLEHGFAKDGKAMVTPFLTDGAMAWYLDMLALRKVRISQFQCYFCFYQRLFLNTKLTSSLTI